MLQRLKIGDQVTVLPELGAPPSEVIEIAGIGFAGTGYVQLEDGRMYSRTDELIRRICRHYY